MNRNISAFRMALLAIAAAFTLLSPGICRSEISGSWTRHYSFDHQLATMAASPEGLYILMHPMEYRPAASQDIATVQAHPFLLAEGSERITPLADLYQLSGEAVRIMRYNPTAEYLLLGYEDGNIDLIYGDGSLKQIGDLSLAPFPGGRKLHEASFSIDGSAAYVATDFGYMRINSSSASASIIDLGGGLKAIARIGNKLVAILPDGSPVCAPATASHISEFKPLMTDESSDARLLDKTGKIVNPLNMIPVADNAFCYLAYLPTGKTALGVAVARGDSWHIVFIEQDGFRLTPSSMCLNSMADNNGTLTRDGVYFHANNIAYQILRNSDFSLSDDEIREKAVQVRYKTADNLKESATYDFSRYWFFNEREGIYFRDAESGYAASTKWLDRSKMIVPDLPAAYFSDEIAWHPQRGLILQNHGINQNFSGQRTAYPSALSGLSAGKWSNYAPAWHTPSFSDASLLSLFKTRILEYPLSMPRGVELDPDNPDFVYSGSLMGGIARFNLADPAAPILHFSHPGDKCAGFPGYVNFAKTMQAWSVQCSFSTPRFDSEGNLWSIFYDLDAQRAGNECATIYLWTREDRLASVNANTDASLARPWHILTYPGFRATNLELLLPLKNSVNRNMLVATGNNYNDSFLVIDHRGTLTDTSDDRVVTIASFTDQNGAATDKAIVNCLREDPSTGLVWVGAKSGVFYFSPAASMHQPGVSVRPTPFDPGNGTENTLIESICVNDIAFDRDGRKWFATYGSGVVCLSADNHTIEGHWTSLNSSLPSDCVYAVGCNLADGTVLASTDQGLAEFIPDGSPRKAPGLKVRVTPSRVEPDFRGLVSIKGLTSSTSYAILNSGGETVREFTAAADGSWNWDASSGDGRRCPTGRYTVSPLSEPGIITTEIIIL